MPFGRKTYPSGMPTEVIRPKPRGAPPTKSPKQTKPKEVSLLNRVRKFFGAAITTAFVTVATANPALAAAPSTNVQCQTQWANAFKPFVDDITGNLKGLFVYLAVAIVVGGLALFALMHMTRHRTTILQSIFIVFGVAVALVVVPVVLVTFLAHDC